MLLNIFCSNTRVFIKKNTSENIEIETGSHASGIQYMEVLKDQDKIITIDFDYVLKIRRLSGELLKSVYISKREGLFSIHKILYNDFYNTVFLFGEFGKDGDAIIFFDVKTGNYLGKWATSRQIYEPVFRDNGKKLFINASTAFNKNEQDADFRGTIEFSIRSKNELTKINFIKQKQDFSGNQNYVATTVKMNKFIQNVYKDSGLDQKTLALMNQADELANKIDGGMKMYSSDSVAVTDLEEKFRGEFYALKIDNEFLYLIHERKVYFVDGDNGQIWTSEKKKFNKYGTLRIKHGKGEIVNAFLNKQNNSLIFLSNYDIYSYDLNTYLKREDFFEPQVETKNFSDPESGRVLTGKYYKDKIIEDGGYNLFQSTSETVNPNFLMKENNLYFFTTGFGKSVLRVLNVKSRKEEMNIDLKKIR